MPITMRKQILFESQTFHKHVLIQMFIIDKLCDDI